MPQKTFGRLVDELLTELERQNIPNKINPKERKQSDPGDKFEVMTTKSIWFADPTNKELKKYADPNTPMSKAVEKRLSQSMLEVLWKEKESGLKRILAIITGRGC